MHEFAMGQAFHWLVLKPSSFPAWVEFIEMNALVIIVLTMITIQWFKYLGWVLKGFSSTVGPKGNQSWLSQLVKRIRWTATATLGITVPICATMSGWQLMPTAGL